MGLRKSGGMDIMFFDGKSWLAAALGDRGQQGVKTCQTTDCGINQIPLETVELMAHVHTLCVFLFC